MLRNLEPPPGLRVRGHGYSYVGLGFRGLGFGFRGLGFGFRGFGFGFRGLVFGFRGFGVLGLGVYCKLGLGWNLKEGFRFRA